MVRKTNVKKTIKRKISKAKPPLVPIPRRSYDDDKEVEWDEIVRRFGGTRDDWEVNDGFWVVRRQDPG